MPVRTVMRKMLSIASLIVVLGTVRADAAQRQGTVESADPTQVTVSGQTYAIDRETELLDRGGQRIRVSELVPGTAVELEIDDDGRLVTLRATLVR